MPAARPGAEPTTRPIPIVRDTGTGGERRGRGARGDGPSESRGTDGEAAGETAGSRAAPPGASRSDGATRDARAVGALGRARASAAVVHRAARERRRAERLEVRRFTRRHRRRRQAWIAAVSAVVVVAVLAFGAAFSPLFAVRDITVAGVTGGQAAAVRDALAGQVGRPLALVDHRAIDRELSRFPLLASYSVEARPPHSLVVDVVPRQPVGQVRTSGGWDTVDPAGVVLASHGEQADGLPAISSGAVGSSSFLATTAVLRSLPASVLATTTAASASTADDVRLTLTSGRTVVWGSASRSALKAADLAALIRAGVTAGTIDVSSPEAPVTR